MHVTNSIEDRPASALNYAKLFVAHGLKISHAPDFGGWPAPDLDAFVVIYCYIVSKAKAIAALLTSVVALQTSKSKPRRRELVAIIGGLIYGCLPIETLLRCSTPKPCSVEAAPWLQGGQLNVPGGFMICKGEENRESNETRIM